MLDSLSQKQVELAFQYLNQPVLSHPPPLELQELNDLEWFLLERMLQKLLKEKDESPLQ